MYNTGFSENIHSYVNNINTIEGGTHLAGFRRALTRTLKKYAEDSKMLEKVKVEISGDDFRIESFVFETAVLIHYATICQQEYEIGKPLYPVKEVGIADHTGTKQQFWPDESIFTETIYDYKILASRLRELAI